MVLLLDEPFMGLDPPTVASLSPLLHAMAEQASPRLVLSARPQDPLPEWITHLIYLRTDCQVAAMGHKETVIDWLGAYVRGVRSGRQTEDEKMPVRALGEMGRVLTPGGVEGRGFDESAQQVQVQMPSKDVLVADHEPLREALWKCQAARCGTVTEPSSAIGQ